MTDRSTVTNKGERWEEAYQLRAGPAGDYAVTCGDARVLVLSSGFAADLVKKLGGTLLVAFVVPFLIGVTGLGLFIWGVVRYSTSRRAVKRNGFRGPSATG